VGPDYQDEETIIGDSVVCCRASRPQSEVTRGAGKW